MRDLRSGFSLVELMIVVAIIGILAAIAIPSYVNMQMKAKRSELFGNVDGVKTAETAYEAANDAYVTTGAYPLVMPGKTAVSWVVSESGDFQTLGWSPDGKVRGQYRVDGDEAASDFTVVAQCDIDANGHFQEVQAGPTFNATMLNGDDVY